MFISPLTFFNFEFIITEFVNFKFAILKYIRWIVIFMENVLLILIETARNHNETNWINKRK